MLLYTFVVIWNSWHPQNNCFIKNNFHHQGDSDHEGLFPLRDHGTDTLDANDCQQAHFDSQNKVGWQQLTPIYSGDGETLIP